MRWPWSRGLATVLLICGCKPVAVSQQSIALVGTGSTVPAPLFSKLTEAYNQHNPKVQVKYLASSTSDGIAAMSHGVGDFAAGELPLTAKQRSQGKLVEVPAVVIAIVPIYNLPGLQKELRFSGEVLADIFLGKIKSWDSPAVAKSNPGIRLPALPIKVMHRSPGKGSNYILTEFLSKVSPEFRNQVGTSASPEWPVGSNVERSSDMVSLVMSEPGAIGYVEAQYAVEAHIPFGLVLNSAGHFVKASPESLMNACRIVESPAFDNFSASLTNPPGPNSFPITSFDWLYLHTKIDDPKRSAAIEEFLEWLLSDGQRIAVQAGYAELPTPLRAKINARLRDLK